MNAKTCKKLRRTAEAATVGMATILYAWPPTGTRRLVNCTRAAYRQLKAVVRSTPA